MSEINDLLSKSANTVAVNTSLHTSYGIVTKINEKENTCDIRYVTQSGKTTSKENVEVLINYNTDSWFPSKLGERVKIAETSSNHPIIIGSYIRDYAQDVKAKRRYAQDVQPGRKYQVRNKIT